MSFRGPQKILLVGGNGLLGSSLKLHLEAQHLKVVVISRNTEESVDFTDETSAFNYLESEKPNTIINLAAMTNVDLCEQFPDQAYVLNYNIIRHISKWCCLNFKQNKDAHLIHISTDMVYDNLGFNLEKNVIIKNHYAGSKLAGELCIDFPNSTILRVNFFGKSIVKHRSSYTDWIYNNLQNNINFNTISDVEFNPLSLNSLCKALTKVVLNPAPGLFNVGAKTKISKSDFSFLFSEKVFPQRVNLLNSVKLTKLNLKAPRPRLMAMNSDLFETTFNIKLNSIEEEIELTIKDYK